MKKSIEDWPQPTSQEYRDELGKTLKKIRSSDKDNPEIARAKALGYLGAHQELGFYPRAKEEHISDNQDKHAEREIKKHWKEFLIASTKKGVSGEEAEVAINEMQAAVEDFRNSGLMFFQEEQLTEGEREETDKLGDSVHENQKFGDSRRRELALRNFNNDIFNFYIQNASVDREKYDMEALRNKWELMSMRCSDAMKKLGGCNLRNSGYPPYSEGMIDIEKLKKQKPKNYHDMYTYGFIYEVFANFNLSDINPGQHYKGKPNKECYIDECYEYRGNTEFEEQRMNTIDELWKRGREIPGEVKRARVERIKKFKEFLKRFKKPSATMG